MSDSSIKFRFEVTVLPVSDVDRAKTFYESLGWRLDADFPINDNLRIVQFTPPGSPASIQFGVGLTAAAPGSSQDLMLIVSDIEAAREELLGRGVKVGELWHGLRGLDTSGRQLGAEPERQSYGSYASFTDPDGNGWLLQEVTVRLPGR
ncbi:VOC family protein [Micromonospora costi]|uniref:Glyoxalase n=1 Tax=Micromonospora costi TaxID=1530042 RepID=A0A3B0A485_9ACTN|nr:VOC family protein [Micromonospora costi]RKN55303.1 glyoxalase [Micromonospora costi]